MRITRIVELLPFLLCFLSISNASATLGDTPLSLTYPYTLIYITELTTNLGVPYKVIIQQNTRGMVLKEFVYQDKVFAQLWFGATIPSLSLLLGNNYYPRYENALYNLKSINHRQVQIDDKELTVTNFGRMGDFWGTSYLSNQFPNGFSVNDIQ